MFKIQLGVTVTDKISGFTGIVTGRCDYTTGCNRYQVQPKVGDDNKFVDSVWYDEHVLTVDTTKEPMSVQPQGDERPGAYGSDPR